MAWTLRLYDSEGIEIAWVRADPYEWKITHPNESSVRFDVEAEIAGLADAHQKVGGNPEFESPEGRLQSTFVVFHGETPKKHLEWVEENMQYADGVESTVLTDE